MYLRRSLVILVLVVGHEGKSTLMDLPPQNPNFVGRENLLQGTDEIFKKTSFVTLTGTPGFGKSQIAKQYAYAVSQKYHIVWWFEAGPTLPHQFEKFAFALNLILRPSEKLPLSRLSPEMLTHIVKHTLFRKRLRCLFIFDNVRQTKDIAPYLFTHSKNLIHTLVTTCTKGDPQFSVKVDPFTREESCIFLRKWFPKESQETLNVFAAYLSDHPLALSTATNFLITHPTVSITHYKASHDLQAQEENTLLSLDQHKHTLYITLKIARDTLVREHPDASQVLAFLTLLHPQHIPVSYVKDFLKRKKKDNQTDVLLGTLYTQSLIEVYQDKNPEKMRLSMHELTHQLLYDQLSKLQKKKLLEEGLATISPFFAGRSDLFVKHIVEEPEHLLQAQKLVREAQKLGVQTIPLLSLKIRLLECLMGGFRDFEAAKELIPSIQADQKVLASQLSMLSPIDHALLELNVGYFEGVYVPDYSQSIPHEKRALEILEESSPSEHEEILRAISGLAQSYLCMGDLKEGARLVELGKKHLHYSEAILTNIFFTCGVWGLWLVLQGKLEEALTLIEKTEPLLKDVKFPLYEIALLIDKAEILAKLGRCDLCDQLIKKGRTLAEEFFETRESNLMGSLLLIQALNTLGQRDQASFAISLAEQALGIFERVFHGPRKHYSQGLGHFILGQLYESQGQLQKAAKAYVMSDLVYEAVFKEKGCDDVSRLYTAMALLGLKRGDLTMAKLYARQHIDTFGYDHPRTREIICEADRRKIGVLE